jgi:hypothetical protein
MSAPSRGKIKTPDGRIVEITDQEFQYGRWWSKKIDQFNREIYSFRNPMPLEKGGELPEFHFKRIDPEPDIEIGKIRLFIPLQRMLSAAPPEPKISFVRSETFFFE